MRLSELTRRFVGSPRFALFVFVVVPIATGLSAGFIVDDATDSSEYGVWVVVAVTALLVSIIRRTRRRS